MEDRLQELETELFTAERTWCVEDIPVLTATVSLPRPADRARRTARRIDRFYQLQARAYLRYCENWLFPQAAAAYRQALADSGPLPCCTAALTYQTTCCQRGIWSLHTDSRECIDGRTEVLRRGDTWDLRTGYPIPLSAFFPRRTPVRRLLVQTAAEEIRRQEAAGTAQYRDGWRQALNRSFSRENFFITPDGIRFFWQMFAIAPRAEGTPTFSLPFGQAGCRWPTPQLPGEQES
jgi:hypothetical protein